MKISGTSLLLVALTSANAFSVQPQHAHASLSSTKQSSTTALGAKGFGAPKKQKQQKSAGQVKREQESSKYDEIASTGGQEYAIYIRQFGGDDQSWLPCGSIAVPRNAQVSDAIFSNESALKSSIVRTYPKLQGYEQEFEFGFNLKVYPDDPIEVAAKGGTGKSTGPSIGNWISNLLSPVDASQAAPPN